MDKPFIELATASASEPAANATTSLLRLVQRLLMRLLLCLLLLLPMTLLVHLLSLLLHLLYATWYQRLLWRTQSQLLFLSQRPVQRWSRAPSLTPG